jgi:phenylalanyl-tRNA synthetase beta chain
MNILIPHSWLLEHLDTKVEPTEIQKLVSLCGPSIERIYDRQNESVYDIEVTTNRVDSMSVRGIAREIAVILSQFGHKAKLKPLRLPALADYKPADTTDVLPLPKVTLKTEACHRALGVILSTVTRAATPAYMAKRLEQTDQNVHDAVIDITNYITHELGHPCHAFDYDRIMELGGEIIVTEAVKGKKFTTLDGAEFTTVGGEIVFENPAGEIIDLPAIKGTANTSINAQTKNILFWIESLDAKKVRVASMTHAIRTVAAQLVEKQVDPHLADSVMSRGIQLFQELCNAKIASPVYDAFITPRHPKTIQTPIATVTNYLGLTLPNTKLVEILTQLECVATISPNNQTLVVTPPTFRHDLEIPADVIEEIARIYGYQNLPSQLMTTAIPLIKPTTVNFDLEFKLKHSLADHGWQELYTYSLVDEKLAAESGYAVAKHLKIANPLTDDKVYLRRSLLPSLLAIAQSMSLGDTTRQTIKVFELANTYTPSESAEKLPAESMRLSFVSNQPFREVVGELTALLQTIYRPDVVIEPNPTDSSKASITVGKDALGTMQQLQAGWWGIDLSMTQLVTAAKTHPTYQPAPTTTGILEEMTFTLPAKTSVGAVMKTIQTTSELVSAITLKDQYQANYSFTLEYRDKNGSLTSESLTPIRKKIVTVLAEKFHARLVGKV